MIKQLVLYSQVVITKIFRNGHTKVLERILDISTRFVWQMIFQKTELGIGSTRNIKERQQIKIHRNEGPTRLGHTILYDTLIDMASNDIVMIYHSDMYLLPGLDTEILNEHQTSVVVSGQELNHHFTQKVQRK